MKKDMTELSEREKFIHHYVTLQTLRVMCNRFAAYERADFKALKNIANVDPEKDITTIRNTRCRRLTDKEISELMEGLTQEALLGGSILNKLID